MRLTRVVLLAVAIAALSSAATASAKLLGEFTRFQQCPWTNAEVEKCLYMVSKAGTLTVGSKKITIEKPIVLQGGMGEPVKGIAPMIGATNGVTLSKGPQNVPGGLLGLVPEAKQPWLVKSLIKFFIENMLTSVSATLELAKPASEIEVGELNLLAAEGTALKLPLKVRLENPFLGKACHIGSNSAPITWRLTTGWTNPPAPNKPIGGTPGTSEFLEKSQILQLNGSEPVDNAWAGSTVNGCGGGLDFLVDPIVEEQLGDMSAGHNSAALKSTVSFATAANVKAHND
jgi:hypothetical protein